MGTGNGVLGRADAEGINPSIDGAPRRPARRKDRHGSAAAHRTRNGVHTVSRIGRPFRDPPRTISAAQPSTESPALRGRAGATSLEGLIPSASALRPRWPRPRPGRNQGPAPSAMRDPAAFFRSPKAIAEACPPRAGGPRGRPRARTPGEDPDCGRSRRAGEGSLSSGPLPQPGRAGRRGCSPMEDVHVVQPREHGPKTLEAVGKIAAGRLLPEGKHPGVGGRFEQMACRPDRVRKRVRVVFEADHQAGGAGEFGDARRVLGRPLVVSRVRRGLAPGTRPDPDCGGAEPHRSLKHGGEGFALLRSRRGGSRSRRR